MNTATESKNSAAVDHALQTEQLKNGQKPRHRIQWHLLYQVPAFLLVGLLLLELFFAASGVGLEEILQPDPALGTHHIPNKKVVWRMEGYSSGTLNSTGMRDIERTLAKPAGVYRVALLGDSATEGLQVSRENTYASYLERMYASKGINAEVLNFGCSGYSTGQEVLQFEREIAQYKPDLTILLYNRGDATENIRKPWDLKVEPRPYFYLDQAGTLHEDDAVLLAHKDAFKPSPVMDFLRQHSCIYGVFSHSNLNLNMNEPLFRKLRGWFTFAQNKQLEREGKRSCAYNIQDNCAVTNALISRLNADCLKCGSKFFVVVFPNINCDPEYASQIPTVEALSKKEGFYYLDLSAPFRWNPNPMSFFVKFHFSAKGHQFVAEKIFETLFPTKQ